MNIEDSITYIKEKIKNRLPEYTETFVDGKPYRMDVLQLETRWTKKTAEAIETLLTAYEKEKEERERIEKLYYEANENCIKYEKMIKKEKEKNKELEKENKKLNLIRLQFLVSSFPDTTETYKKYRKELDELLKEE